MVLIRRSVAVPCIVCLACASAVNYSVRLEAAETYAPPTKTEKLPWGAGLYSVWGGARNSTKHGGTGSSSPTTPLKSFKN